MIKFIILLKQKICIFLIKLGCYFNFPIITAFILYFILFRSKKIKVNRTYKKTAIIFYKSNGISDIESSFNNNKSKNRILLLERMYLREINYFFLKKNNFFNFFNFYKSSIKQHIKSKKNQKYDIFLTKIISWLNFFLGNFYFVSFNFAYPEEFYLRDVCLKKKIPYLILYKESIRTKGNYNLTFGKTYKDTLDFNKNIFKIAVYNNDTCRELIKNNIFKKNQINITGMPRSLTSLKKKKNIKKENITFFLISKLAGIPQDKKLLPNTIKNFNWEDVNQKIISTFNKISRRFPHINFIIKSKAGIDKKIVKKIKESLISPNIKFYIGGAGHLLIQSSFIVIAFNSTTVFEAILNKKKVIVPYFKKYRKKIYKDYIHDYPKNLYVKNERELVKEIEITINSKSINNKIGKNHYKLINKYLGDIKNAPKNMRNFLNI
jgi:hypothetical protein